MSPSVVVPGALHTLARPPRPRRQLSVIMTSCSLVSRVLSPLSSGDRIDEHGVLRVSQMTKVIGRHNVVIRAGYVWVRVLQFLDGQFLVRRRPTLVSARPSTCPETPGNLVQRHGALVQRVE